ncbi:MAG TPA: decaprenyl-phosphate phosphoribosyltransferase [Nitrospiria bacterium]|jgi:4-hydroxybenzoate polyprenyltransferase|nr:decaprenyl-phosphate phosphoribosyltransferase [Nitrospiria bacterium]
MAVHSSEQVFPSTKNRTSGAAAGLTALRPLDWLKNLFVLAPLLFSGRLIDYPLAAKSLLGFLLFCILSSGAYLFNDLMDREEDRRHPAKALRPIASGLLPPSMAGGISFGLILVGLIGASALDLRFGMVAFVFSLLHLAYSIGLKDWVIVDVLLIAAGFVLRVLAGSALVAVLPSAWIILCTMLLSVFLGFSKRRHELVLLGGQAKAHRKVLEQYSLAFLDQMIGAVLAATVVSYALYTINNGPLQIYSVFFVLYGMFRYLYLIHHRGHGGRAAESFLTDRPLLATVLGWTLFMLWDIYLRG